MKETNASLPVAAKFWFRYEYRVLVGWYSTIQGLLRYGTAMGRDGEFGDHPYRSLGWQDTAAPLTSNLTYLFSCLVMHSARPLIRCSRSCLGPCQDLEHPRAKFLDRPAICSFNPILSFRAPPPFSFLPRRIHRHFARILCSAADPTPSRKSTPQAASVANSGSSTFVLSSGGLAAFQAYP